MGLLSSITDSIFPGLGGMTDGLFGTQQGAVPYNTTQSPWGPQQSYLKDIFAKAKGQYGASQSSPFASFLQNAATQGTPLTNAGQNTLLGTARGDYLDPYSNPYFSGALNQTLGDVKSQINSNFRGDNFGNSAHQEWLGRGLTNAALPMLSNQYNSERSNQLGAVGMIPSYENQNLQLMQMANDQPWKNLSNYGQLVSGQYGGTTNSEQPYFQNNTATTLGALAGGAGLLKMFSDRRLKSNIEKVADHPNGFGIYEYDIFGRRERGVMADEVEKIVPEAVSTDKSGFQVVDYARL